MNEQTEMMMQTIKQFADESIADIALKIEREGIPDDLYQKIIQQGLIGATLPPEMGGAGLDRSSYDAILFQLAKASPSVAFHVFMNNSIILRFLEKAGKKDEISDVISGKERYGFAPGPMMEGGEDDEGYLIIEPNSKNLIVDGNDGSIFISNAKPELLNKKPLGLRGLRTDIAKGTGSGQKILSMNDAELIWEEGSWHAAAVFLGLAEGALDKAIEYTKVRKTFNYSLKDYEPVAFRLCELKSEMEILKNTLFGDKEDTLTGMMLKTISSEFARRATKYALQFHGGYGYLEDFGVEKFYRDAVALNSIMFRPVRDKRSLASKIYQEKSGFL